MFVFVVAFYRRSRNHQVEDGFVYFRNGVPAYIEERPGVRRYLNSASSSGRVPLRVRVNWEEEGDADDGVEKFCFLSVFVLFF